MADKLMNIPNEFTQNYHFCRFELVVGTFEHSNKSKFNNNCQAND